MLGSSSLNDRYDGKPNKMQLLLKEMDFVSDFLFGFTGYEHHKCIDRSQFKDVIVESIDAGKPVIAEGVPGEGRGGCYHVITGYNGDTLMCPDDDYFYKKARPNGAPGYEELVTLYVFGEKTAPRYTLKDGLENIRRVREYNLNERIWDDYLNKIGGWEAFPSDDGLDKADMEEKRKRLKRMFDTICYTMNTHCVQKAFQGIHIRHEEMFDPALEELWEKIHRAAKYMGHGPEKLIARIKWDTIRPATFRGISEKICEAIVKVKEADKKCCIILIRQLKY